MLLTTPSTILVDPSPRTYGAKGGRGEDTECEEEKDVIALCYDELVATVTLVIPLTLFLYVSVTSFSLFDLCILTLFL